MNSARAMAATALSATAELPTSKKKLQGLANAGGWEAEVRVGFARSERRAWQVATSGVLVGLLGMASALYQAMQPAPAAKVLTLDRVTGETQILPNLDGKHVPQVVALDHHNAAVYVRAREGYNYSMLGRDYDQVARMSTPEAWAAYGRRFGGAEPMHEKVADRELHRITVISVRLATGYSAGKAGEALVTYEREVRTQQSVVPTITRHLATLRYEYRPASMKRDVDRTENPFGFVVLAYRTDAELAASRVGASAVDTAPKGSTP